MRRGARSLLFASAAMFIQGVAFQEPRSFMGFLTLAGVAWLVLGYEELAALQCDAILAAAQEDIRALAAALRASHRPPEPSPLHDPTDCATCDALARPGVVAATEG